MGLKYMHQRRVEINAEHFEENLFFCQKIKICLIFYDQEVDCLRSVFWHLFSTIKSRMYLWVNLRSN